ncbi:MAG TPA: retropepsin-like aspartic protease [Candidatus Binatus sp.]|nr:retropepsin-like aspartic protease [Candidatus Binatus sp.]
MRHRPIAVAVLLVALVSTTLARAEWTAAGGGEVPLDGNGQSWLVHATLNGRVTGLFLLDTGASYCVLAPTTARRLGLPATSERAELRTANGVVHAPLVRLRTVDVGKNRAKDVAAVVHTAVSAPLDGVIGLSYLNNFSTYSIDSRRRTLRLR